MSLFVLPSVFISQITRKDTMDTVYFSLRGMISVKSQIIQPRVYTVFLCNISSTLTEQQFEDGIFASTGVKVGAVSFRNSSNADTLMALVSFKSSEDLHRVDESIQDEGPLDWNAKMPLHVTCQSAVYKQLEQYGDLEIDGEASGQKSTDTSCSSLRNDAPITSTLFHQCMSSARLVLQPGASCFVPADSCRSLCSETQSLLLCIEFDRYSSPDEMVCHETSRHNPKAQTFYLWSAIPSWLPHQFRTRAGDEVTARRHKSACSRPLIRLLNASHSKLEPFLELARVRAPSFFALFRY